MDKQNNFMKYQEYQNSQQPARNTGDGFWGIFALGIIGILILMIITGY